MQRGAKVEQRGAESDGYGEKRKPTRAGRAHPNVSQALHVLAMLNIVTELPPKSGTRRVTPLAKGIVTDSETSRSAGTTWWNSALCGKET